MDTKPLETEALNQIKALLGRYGFQYAELNFDEEGADFFTVKKVLHDSQVYWRCMKSQSKGRDVSRHCSNIRIPRSYVTDDFLVFVYVKPEEVDDANTFLFTAEDIRNTWKETREEYELYLPKDFISRQENETYVFNKTRSTIINDLLDCVSKERKDEDVRNLSDAEFYFKMWQKTGGLPPVEYIIDIFMSEDNMSVLADTGIFIFLLCASVIDNYDFYESLLSIDWAFAYLKEYWNRIDEFENVAKGRSYRSDVALTFFNTWVLELLSNDGQIIGYHLHMSDDEEAIDARVMKNGDYGVVYK